MDQDLLLNIDIEQAHHRALRVVEYIGSFVGNRRNQKPLPTPREDRARLLSPTISPKERCQIWQRQDLRIALSGANQAERLANLRRVETLTQLLG